MSILQLKNKEAILEKSVYFSVPYEIRIPRPQWFRGRASDSRLRGPGFESCDAVLRPWESCFTLHCSSCIHVYMAIDSVYEQPSRINFSILLNAS